jgi:hypothetical protein
LSFLSFLINFSPWLLSLPSDTATLVVLITTITIYTALSLSILTLAIVYVFYYNSYRKNVILARNYGWKAVLKAKIREPERAFPW